ncbi:anti-sigma factor [Paraburkholderia sp.]|uniref:anti-sigma factor n=1 Tax=Paraburkholderia sp. TaxID=1926495 RepID=UPI0023993FC8|nr:anti-sigma factor [Paraburkholderia sp.]MDE1182687.1 anti-sigma factor [Paraburkholderia sp.]
MNLHRYPELVDLLAAEYVLGTLRGGARRRMDTYAAHDVVIKRTLEQWTRRLEPMSELTDPRMPPASVWEAIERQLGFAPAAPSRAPARVVPPTPRWFESVAFWRGWAFAGTALAAVAVVFALRANLETAPVPAPVTQQAAAAPLHVAVLNGQDAKPVMLVTWDESHGTMTLRKLTDIAPPPGKTMELWGLPANGHPVSLGVMPDGAEIKLAAGAQKPESYAALAVSIEPPGGSPNHNAPSGPVVLSGRLLSVS